MSQNLTKKLSPRNWRSQAAHDCYEKERKQGLKSDTCPLCEENPIIVFNFWKILPNKYPYDAVSKKHDLLLPIRHIGKFEQLTDEEREELKQLKDGYLNLNYVFFIEAMNKNKSIPGHLHYHLIEPKVIDL